MTTLSVVIPALNEEDSIQSVMDRVLSTEPQLHMAGINELELIVVDDGSVDHTRQLVADQQRACLICHAANGGYGAALKTGFAAAHGEWIGFLDADGTYPPEYFPRLCQVALEQDADIVVGTRMGGADSHMPPVRRLGNLLFARLVSLVSAQAITDSASGMRVFRKSILSRIYPLPDGLNLTPVMSTRALHERLRMVEEPIPYDERAGHSKLHVLQDGIRFAQSIVWTALSYNPARLLGIIGMAAITTAALIGIGLVLARLQGITYVGPGGAFVLFAAVVLAVSGVSLVVLGISFNYFVALFHSRPVRQGLFGRPIFSAPVDRHFGWVGLVSLLGGVTLGLVSLTLGVAGWPVARIWLYYLIAAGFALIGLELMVAWVQIRVLDALHGRDQLVAQDMLGSARIETSEDASH